MLIQVPGFIINGLHDEPDHWHVHLTSTQLTLCCLLEFVWFFITYRFDFARHPRFYWCFNRLVLRVAVQCAHDFQRPCLLLGTSSSAVLERHSLSITG
jgi:hypothetical protein